MSDIQSEDQKKVRPSVRPLSLDDPNNQIGIKLRSLYDALQEEAIPDRFLDLLEKLDEAEHLAFGDKSK